jgi:hypothetical protein
MDIQILRTLVQEFGLSIAISVIFVTIAVKFIKNTIDQNNKLMKMILEDHRKKDQIEVSEKHKESINLRLEVNKRISRLLDDFRRDHEADRVYIFEYHNGESNLNGLAFAKMSETYESSRPGFTSHKVAMQGVPTGMMISLNQEVLINEQVCVRSVSDFRRDNQDQSLLNITKYDTKSLYIKLIKNSKDYPIGFIGVDFVKEEMAEETELDLMDELEALSYKISSLLEIEDMKKLNE